MDAILKKKPFEIEPLSTVDEILKKLSFLRYSTQLRNLAYQIQLLEFLRSLHKNYKIDRGLQNIFVMQICYTSSIIIEHLLYCGINDRIKLSKYKKASSLNNMAKKLSIIDKKTRFRLEEIIDIRNDLHPEKQKELHTKKIDESYIEKSINCINDLVKALRAYHEN